MTINPSTGEINWPNPQSNASPTITVRDAEGNQRSATWAIEVTTAGFRFVDPVNGNDSSAGTLAAPWRSILKLYNVRNAADIIYFRGGTHVLLGLPRDSTDDVNGGGGAWFDSGQSSRWLAFPGERAVIDYAFTPGSPYMLLRFVGTSEFPTYIDGLEFRNFGNIAVQLTSGQRYLTVRRARFIGQVRPINGGNPGGIMTTRGDGNESRYTVVQDNEFADATVANGSAMKLYSQEGMLIENNLFRDLYDGFDPKANMVRFDIRANEFRGITNRALHGNYITYGLPFHGEIRYNLINAPNATVALRANENGEAGVRLFVVRNTIIGVVEQRGMTSSNGSFTYDRNIIVNSQSGTPSGSRISSYGDVTRLVLRENLVGAPSAGIVDSGGNLTSEYRQYLGQRGHALASTTIPPMPPDDVSVN
jgi:hypothetical protein